MDPLKCLTQILIMQLNHEIMATGISLLWFEFMVSLSSHLEREINTLTRLLWSKASKTKQPDLISFNLWCGYGSFEIHRMTLAINIQNVWITRCQSPFKEICWLWYLIYCALCWRNCTLTIFSIFVGSWCYQQWDLGSAWDITCWYCSSLQKLVSLICILFQILGSSNMIQLIYVVRLYVVMNIRWSWQ